MNNLEMRMVKMKITKSMMSMKIVRMIMKKVVATLMVMMKMIKRKCMVNILFVLL